MNWKKPFFTIASGQTISLIGSSAVQFAMIWWLASETSSALMLSLAGLVAFLPQLVLGPFAGVWIDRLKRKHVVIGADMFIGLLALGFSIWFLVDSPPYWSVFLVLSLRAVGNVFHTPAIQSVTPLIVPESELVRANGLNQFLQSGAFMLGPVIGGIMFEFMPFWVILLTDLIGAVVASIAIGIIPIPQPPPQQKESHHFLREFKEGFKIFFGDKALATLLVAAFICMVFIMPMATLYPLMTSDHFRLEAIHASIVEFLYAFGMMAISLAVGIFGRINNKLLSIHFGLLGIGITCLLSGILPSTLWGFWVFAALCFFMGASANFYGIPITSHLQETIPQHLMGRAFSLWGSVMSLSMPVGLLISGPIAEKYGVPFWFIIAGAVTTIAPCISYIYLKKNNLTTLSKRQGEIHE